MDQPAHMHSACFTLASTADTTCDRGHGPCLSSTLPFRAQWWQLPACTSCSRLLSTMCQRQAWQQCWTRRGWLPWPCHVQTPTAYFQAPCTRHHTEHRTRTSVFPQLGCHARHVQERTSATATLRTRVKYTRRRFELSPCNTRGKLIVFRCSLFSDVLCFVEVLGAARRL